MIIAAILHASTRIECKEDFEMLAYFKRILLLCESRYAYIKANIPKSSLHSILVDFY